jgi:hypothetical protein
VKASSLCPSCAPGREARALFFGDGFLANMTVVLLPLFLTLAVAILVHRLLVRSDKRSP